MVLKFSAPDGKEFSNKAEYRDYMMDNYYSFKNKKNIKNPLIKNPGDVEGQVFDIADCENVTLIVMDVTDQVQIDNLQDCRVFIGCCSASIFIRNCTNCTFFTSSRQLRVREAVSCTFYSYCQSEIHIEMSKELQFGPFLGGYPLQSQHFQQAGLDPSKNLWYDIYDHSDPDKNHTSWRLLRKEEMEDHWFPAGDCQQFINNSNPPASNSQVTDTAQVGQSFGLDQMRADAQMKPNPRHDAHDDTPSPVSVPIDAAIHPGDRLCMEVALMVVTASSKEINVSVWFNEQTSGGLIPLRDFNSKLESLSCAMGMNQDAETKRELEIAVCRKSLRDIQMACGDGSDEFGHPLINVTYFIQLCQEKVDRYLADMDEAGDIELKGGPSTPQKKSPSKRPGKSTSAGGKKEVWAMSVEEYIADSKAHTGTNAARPHSPPPGQRRGGSASEATGPALVDPEDFFPSPKASTYPSSPNGPYDEEIDFDADEEEEEMELDSVEVRKQMQERAMQTKNQLKRTKKAKTQPKRYSRPQTHTAPLSRRGAAELEQARVADIVETIESEQRRISRMHWEAENKKLLTREHTHQNAPVPRQRPSSAGPRLGARKPASSSTNVNMTRTSTSSHDIRMSTGASTTLRAKRLKRPVSASTGQFSRPSAGEETRSRLLAAERRHSFGDLNSSRLTQEGDAGQRGRGVRPKSAGKGKLSNMKDLVEDLIRMTVKKADLYHIIQVSLGFLESYTLIPPRGSILTARRRDWLTHRELQTAFMAARLCLTDPQIVVLKSLVFGFSKEFDKLYADAENRKSRDNSLSSPARSKKSAVVAAASADVIAELRKKPVIGPGRNLNAEWLRRYLVHLRLTKKQVSATMHPAPAFEGKRKKSQTKQQETSRESETEVGPETEGGEDEQKGEENGPVDPEKPTITSIEKSPLQWKQWLGNKLKNELKRGPVKPKEFERALSGQNHNLTREDIQLMLRTFTILPPESLKMEIDYRIEAWLLDMDGRRDFQHEMNVKIRNWIWQKKILDQKMKIPDCERGYWELWHKLPEETRKQVKSRILESLIKEKKENLLTRERTKQEISRELYWRYDADRKMRLAQNNSIPFGWKDWLVESLAKFQSSLQKFREEEGNRQRASAKSESKKKSLAGLNDIELKVQKFKESVSLDAFHQIELQKGVNALRNEAKKRNIAQGTVVTKEDFDKHLKTVLEGTQMGGAADNGDSWSTQFDTLFHRKLDKAVTRVLDVEAYREAKNLKSYNEWAKEKRKENLMKRRKEMEEKEKEEKLKEDKEKRGKKEFRKWLKLRKRNQYKSKMVKGPVVIPAPKIIQHEDRWNYDRELEQFYADQEKRY